MNIFYTLHCHVGERWSRNPDGALSGDTSPCKDVLSWASNPLWAGIPLPEAPRSHSLCVSACPPVGSPRRQTKTLSFPVVRRSRGGTVDA